MNDFISNLGFVQKAAGAVLATVLLAGGAIIGYDQAVDHQDHITVSEAVALRAGADGIEGTGDDVKLVITGLTYWSPCSQEPRVNGNSADSLKNVQTAGIDSAGYFLVSPHESGRQAVDRAMASVPREVWDKLEFVAVDFEVPTECYPQFAVPYETIVDASNRLIELGKCVQWYDGTCRSVIYTSCGEWTSRLDNGTRPKPPNSLLWNASWDGNPDIDYARCQFGGYTVDEVLIEQYNGGTMIAGVHVDSNTYVVRELPAPPEPDDEECGSVFYSREQALWATTAAGFISGMEQFGGTGHRIHPFDARILEHIACRLE